LQSIRFGNYVKDGLAKREYPDTAGSHEVLEMRVKGIDADNPPELIKHIFDRSRDRYGLVIGPNQLMGHRPEILLAASGLGRVIDDSEVIEPRLKVIASVRAAQMIGCPF
jgi:hypothetical protein